MPVARLEPADAGIERQRLIHTSSSADVNESSVLTVLLACMKNVFIYKFKYLCSYQNHS